MLSSRHNFTVDQGSTFRRVLRFKSRATGTYLNLSGYTARMQIRREIDDADFVVELTTENGGITIDGPEGSVSLHATPAQTRLLADGAPYDLELITPSGDIYTPLSGKFRTRREVTR